MKISGTSIAPPAEYLPIFCRSIDPSIHSASIGLHYLLLASAELPGANISAASFIPRAPAKLSPDIANTDRSALLTRD